LGPQAILVDSSLVARALMVTAFAAFILSALVIGGLGRLGISEVYSFMISTPLLIAPWFYSIGWLIDLRALPWTAGRGRYTRLGIVEPSFEDSEP
jgi:hypothetical protein